MHKIRRYLLFLCLAMQISMVGATGFVRISNYGKQQYSGGPQNWCMVQDGRGKAYFGNRDGMLIFDGVRWKHAFLDNYTTIRSLLYDKDTDRVYAGGSEELGYFSHDPATGALIYTSLLKKFGKSRPSFSEVWKIFKIDDNIWFQTDNHFFCLSGDKMTVYPTDGRISTSAVIGRTIYAGLEEGKIETLRNGVFHTLKNADALRGKKIAAILPYGNKGEILACTSLDGLFVYDGTSIQPLPTPLNDFLRKNQIFCARRHGSDYAFGTVNNGAVLTDFTPDHTIYINKETGLQNNTVLSAEFDYAGNIWLCLDNGIDYAVYNSGIRNLIGINSSIGAGYCSFVAGDRMLYGTNQGLFSTHYPYSDTPEPPEMRRELMGQVWTINPTPHGVLIAADTGLHHYDGTGYRHIDGSHGTYKALPLPGDDNRALASTYEGFHLLNFEDGKWSDTGLIDGCRELTGNFFFDEDGNIWMSHWRKGVYLLRLDADARKIEEVHLYDMQMGLPSNDNNTVAQFDGRILFSTMQGFYSPGADGRAKPQEEFNILMGNKKHGAIQSLADGSLAYIDDSGIYILSMIADGSIICKSAATGKFDDELISGYTHINMLSPDEMVVSTQDGFNMINPNYSDERPWKAEPFVSAVYANQDSAVYVSTLSARDAELKLPYALNSLKFEFGFPEFDKSANVEYSSYLENYEDEWSAYTKESSREYTQLGEGDYKMHLRVRDAATGNVREAALGFRISPPWYRSTPAKILYFISLAILFTFLTSAVRKWIEKGKRQAAMRKEQELDELRRRAQQEALKKDYEIASLKTEQLEQDIRHKSEELSTTAMNLIQKNEMLGDITRQIEALQKMVAKETSSRNAIQKSLSKLQSSVEKSIEGDNNWDAFNKTFDIVYQDYTKKLSERHPNLTKSDKRLCCYIRMGLSSKEIAPIINISYKSVEMARYRLRKKIELGPETSLTDYLAAI